MMTAPRDKPPVVMLAGIRWDFLWQRHQALATMFARAGYPTVFVETTGLSDPRPNPYSVAKVVRRIIGSRGYGKSLWEPYVYSPVVLPPTWRVFRGINSAKFVPDMVRDIVSMVGENPVVVAYPPTQTTLQAVSLLKPRRMLYDCSDDYAFFDGIPSDIRDTEKELLEVADEVSCTSRTLLERISDTRPDAFFCGPAVDTEAFSGFEPEVVETVNRVGYFGHLADDRFDLEVFRGIASGGFDVRIFGEVAPGAKRLLRHPGIEFAGKVPHSRLSEALSDVDAFVTPYRDSGLTRGIFPAKTYEMLATGKPVVSSALPSLVGDPDISRCVYFAGSTREFVSILSSLPDTEDEDKVQERLRVAGENSWVARFRQIEERLFGNCA